ncbi:MAG TPA: hypothetical protein IAC67_03420 [Candidatus Coproplasma excrementipullorum]|nr:hypothetical protein [Candidatus Coproplasma excrementipullorum]
MEREAFLQNYWNYYLVLENRFINAVNYVALNSDNYNTYSFEFVNLILLIGSELDVTMKYLSGISEGDRASIQNYADKILVEYPEILTREIKIQGMADTCKPFEGWNVDHPADSLVGWNAYNSVKHGRVSNLKEAKLINVLNLLACLYVIENYVLKDVAEENDDIDIPDQDSKLFVLKDWKRKYISSADIVLKQTETGEPIIDGGKA